MRAVELRGARSVALVEVPRPVAGPGEVLLRVDAALTCGTDAKVFRRGYHARMLRAPCLFGHEYAGVVEEAGAGVERFRPGDAVVGANSAPCGDCEYCAKGKEALCDDLLFVNGAFAEWMRIPARIVERNLYPLPRGIDPHVAAACEPVACVLKGVDLVAPQSGEEALLLGSGPIAAVFAQELRARGVRTVLLARSDAAAARAHAAGTDEVIVASVVPEAEAAVRDRSRGGRGFDLVVEAAGAVETTEAASHFARKGGRVLLFGGCEAEATFTLSPARLHYQEIDILSSFHHTPHYVRAALDALGNGRVDLAPILEESVRLDGVADALRSMCDRSKRGKVPVLPHG
jgi:L-iditol 2-dehydrogenase